MLNGHLESTKSDLDYHGAHRKPRFSPVLRSTRNTHCLYGSTKWQNEDNKFRSEDWEDLISAESLDPLGELQSEKTAPKASKGSSSKRKATLPNVYATSKPRAQ